MTAMQTSSAPASPAQSSPGNGPEKGADDFWNASLQAEMRQEYDLALEWTGAYLIAGGDGFLGRLRTAWLYSLKGDFARAEAFCCEAEGWVPPRDFLLRDDGLAG